jgi:hypothetical protein
MALVPNRTVYAQFPAPVDNQADWTEAMGNMVIVRGYHQNPAKPEDEILIESTTSVQNYWGEELSVVEEKWSIDRHGAPPTMYTRSTYSNQFLPALGGRQLRLCQVEETHYWTFTLLAGNNTENLAKTRRISGYVVYDQPADPTQATDSDTANALTDAGVTPGATRDRLFHTGRLWSDATSKGVIIPEEGHNQFTQWVPDVITVTDRVDEEWDRWILVTITKNALRPGDVQVSEPREIKKDGIRYSLPVPLEPPTLSTTNLTNGVRLKVEGGGAHLPGGWHMDDVYIPPEQYKIYRATISEGDRTDDTNWNDWWEEGAEPATRNRLVIEDTDVTDFDGAPASPLPPTSGHTEPHDPDPPAPEPETYFELIATLDNERTLDLPDAGYASFVDLDVLDAGVYEYYATCTYGNDESPDSNHETVTYSGSEGRSFRIAVRAGVEEDAANGVQADHVDILAPDEPSLVWDDYGSVFEYEIPTHDDVEEVATEIAERQFSERQTPDVITLDVLTPIIGLEYGSQVVLPNVDWTTYTDGLVQDSQTIENQYVLVGYYRTMERKADGTWGSPTTTLRLQEYPR